MFIKFLQIVWIGQFYCGKENLPSWRIPHRRGWQELTSPDGGRATAAWRKEDRIKFSQRCSYWHLLFSLKSPLAIIKNTGKKSNVPPSHLSSQQLSHFVKKKQKKPLGGQINAHVWNLTICLHSSPWGWQSSSPQSPRWHDGWWQDGLCRRHPSC